MATVNEKMTALADEVRELSGTTGKMGIDDMTSVLNTESTNFNTNLATQNDLIEQIQAALQGKAAGGGGAEATICKCYATNYASIVFFREGTTWQEYVNSEFNYRHGMAVAGAGSIFKNIQILNDRVTPDSMEWIHLSLDGTSAGRVAPTDAIIPDYIYQAYDTD